MSKEIVVLMQSPDDILEKLGALHDVVDNLTLDDVSHPDFRESMSYFVDYDPFLQENEETYLDDSKEVLHRALNMLSAAPDEAHAVAGPGGFVNGPRIIVGTIDPDDGTLQLGDAINLIRDCPTVLGAVYAPMLVEIIPEDAASLA